MGLIVPSYVTVNPSFTDPRIIVKYNQASGAMRVLHGGRPEVRLSETDKAVYMHTLDVRTKAAAGQSPYENLPSVSVVGDYISTPTYWLRNRYDFNHHDTAAAGVWGFSADSALRLGSRQGIFQQVRNMLLYGVQSSKGEGMLNAVGVTSTTLPPDSNGNTTFLTYDNGQLAFYFLSLIVANQIRMYQLGMEPLHTVILGPQRILGPMMKVNIVQVVQFQRQGAGTMTTAGTIEEIARMTEDSIEWCFDDTLQGQGAGNSTNNDLIVITMPTVKNPRKQGEIDTNEFASLMPGMEGTNIMYMDMAAPKEIRSPLAGGAVDVLLELLATSGWCVRPEGTTLLTMPYA